MIREYFAMAFKSLFSHKIRSLLTMLGVIIGVFAVILLISLGTSVQNEAAAEINSLGSNLISVSVTDQNGSLPSTWLDDISEDADIAAFSQVISGRDSYVVNGKELQIDISGVNEEYDFISSIVVDQGRFISSFDTLNGTAVAVIGVNVASHLYGSGDPLGQKIVISGIPFEIVGITEERGNSGMTDYDKAVYIPNEIAATIFPSMGSESYSISSINSDTVENTESSINTYLKKHLPSEDLYFVFSQSMILDAMSTIMGLLTVLLAGIAAISLVVGGIGIMNIMLVTVRERTIEIGIRKALGAKKRYILMQFLVETVIITVIGGLIGLALSAAAAAAITALAGFTVSLGIDSVILGITFSVIIGLIFGLYPANKAANLEPVEALRFE